MANKKISELTDVPSSLTGTEPLPIVQGGVTYKSTLQNNWNQVQNLTVQGSATLSGTVKFSTAIDVAGTASAARGLITNLYVSGSATFSGDVICLTTFSVSGNANFRGAVTVSGALNALTTVSVSGNADFRGAVTVSGAINALTTMSVSGNVNFKSDVTVSGALNALTTMSVSGLASFKSGLSVSATVSASVITASGFELGHARLFNSSVTPNADFTLTISGTWSTFPVLDVYGYYTMSGGGTHIAALSVDGGSNYFVATPNLFGSSVSGGDGSKYWVNLRITGNGNTSGSKSIMNLGCYAATGAPGTAVNVVPTIAQGTTATANTGNINQIKFQVTSGGTTQTISTGWFTIYGYR